MRNYLVLYVVCLWAILIIPSSFVAAGTPKMPKVITNSFRVTVPKSPPKQMLSETGIGALIKAHAVTMNVAIPESPLCQRVRNTLNSEYEHHVDTNFCEHLGNEALRLYGTGIDKKEISDSDLQTGVYKAVNKLALEGTVLTGHRINGLDLIQGFREVENKICDGKEYHLNNKHGSIHDFDYGLLVGKFGLGKPTDSEDPQVIEGCTYKKYGSISALVSAMYSEGYRMNELSEQVKSGFRKLFCKQKH